MTDPSVTIPFPPVAERHEESRRLYQARDLEGYMAFFTPDLAYRQANGATIDRQRLRSDVAQQFHRVASVDWISQVESEERAQDRVIEVVHQTGAFITSAFGLIHRVWRLDRRGRYTWKVHEGRWRIAEVHVLDERIVGDGLNFGLRPRLPANTPEPPRAG